MRWNCHMISSDQLILDNKLPFFFFWQIQWTGKDVDAIVVLESVKKLYLNRVYFC